jgi:hypothetical protein
MTYSTDGLHKKQLHLLREMGPRMSSQGFYLAGGTALAIHFAHRLSVDLDWFTPHAFDDVMAVAQSIRRADMNLQIEQILPGTLHGSIKGVRVTFLQYQFPCSSQSNIGTRWDAPSLRLRTLPA